MDKIPAITNPLGKYWEQPEISDIEIDDTHALMNHESFKKLKDYSRSQPTGAYAGKMWKCKHADKWVLRWFSICPDDPKFLINNFRYILCENENQNPNTNPIH